MRSFLCILVALSLVVACGKEESTGSGAGAGNSSSKQASQPKKPKIDPVEQARKEAAAKEQRRKAAVAKKARQKEIAELQLQLDELKKTNKAEADGLPDRGKLRRRLSGMIRDSATAKSIYNTNRRRHDKLKAIVAGAATAEIKALQQRLDKAEKGYYGALSGVKEERAAQALGIVEETQVQKEIRALRAAKKEWFSATRETRRGGAPKAIRSKVSITFRAWINGEPIRKTVIAKALPDGKKPDSYDFSNLDFYLLMELLEDDLDRKNFADEKKTISANDKKLMAMEKEIDALRENIAEKMMAGGGDMEEFTELAENLPAQKRAAESLERAMGQMREVYNEIEATLERHGTAEDALESRIAKLRR